MNTIYIIFLNIFQSMDKKINSENYGNLNYHEYFSSNYKKVDIIRNDSK